MKRTPLILVSVIAFLFCLGIGGGCGERQTQATNINLEELKDMPEFKKLSLGIDTAMIVQYDRRGRLVYKYVGKTRETHRKGGFEGTLCIFSEDSLVPGLLRKTSVYNPEYASEYHRVTIRNDSIVRGRFFEGVVEVLKEREGYDILVEGDGFEKTLTEDGRTVFRRKCNFNGHYRFEGVVRIAGREQKFLYQYVVM